MRLLLVIPLLTSLTSCQQVAGYETTRVPAADGRASEAGTTDARYEGAVFDGGGDVVVAGDGFFGDAGDAAPPWQDSGAGDGLGADLPPSCVGLAPGQLLPGWALSQYNGLTDDTTAYLQKAESAQAPTSWTPSHVVDCLLARDGITDISATEGSDSPTYDLSWGFFASEVWVALSTAIDDQVRRLPLTQVWYHSWGPVDFTLVAVLFFGTNGDVVYLRGFQLSPE